MLTQGDAASFMAELKQQDKTLWEKVRDWFKNLAEKLRGVVDAYQGYTPDSPEGRLVAQMEDFIGALQAAYSEALMDASENYRANEGKKNTTREGGVKYSINQGFYTAFDAWDGKQTNVTFTVGNTSGPLKLIGMKDHEIKMHSGMVISKLNKHKELSRDIFRQIPDLLESPIIVQFSDAINPETGKQKYDNSITVIGELYANTTVNGKTKSAPVLVALNIVPTKKNSSVVLDFSVVKSAYTKDALQNYLNENSILYVDPDKKRTDSWLSRTGLSLPVGENRYGPIRKITYDGGKVKVQNPKNMTDMQKALLKAGAIDEFGNKLFSDRDPTAKATLKALDKQGKALEADVENLMEMLRLQGDVIRKDSSILSAARYLSTYHGVIGSKQDPALNKELAGLLKDFYGYLDTEKDLSWERIAEKAKPVAEWIFKHTEAGWQRNEYARNIQ